MTTLGRITLEEQLWRCGTHPQRPFCTAAHVQAARTPKPVRTLPARGAERIVAEADGTMVPVADTAAAPEPTAAKRFVAPLREALRSRYK